MSEPAATLTRAPSGAEVLRAAGERIGTILTVTAAVVLTTLAVLMMLPTLYSTSASLMLDPRKNNVADISSVLSQLPTDPASLQNQIQILQSHDLAAQVIAKLRLYDDPEFDTALKPGLFGQGGAPVDPAAAREKIVAAFQKGLSVAAEGLSTTLTVTFTARDPQKAALIANTLVDTYIDDQLAAKRDVGSRTTDWLLTRTRDLAQRLQAQEAAIQRYKADNSLTETADGSSLADQQISAISNQLVAAKADLAQKQATSERVAALIKAGDTADVSQILASPLIVQLRTQQALLIAQESDLSTRYGPRHPKMAAVETQRRDLDGKIAVEVSRLAGSIANDVAVARANVASLAASLALAERQASSQDQVRVKLRALESNADSTRTMYQAFVQRLRETQDQDVIQSADARVISHAPVPTAPSWPKRSLVLGASLPGGLLLGLLVALIGMRFEERSPRGARVLPAEAFAGATAPRVPVLAVIDGLSDPRAPDAVLDWPESNIARDMAALRERLRAGARIVAVTGADTGLAKSATVAALARSAASIGLRVVAVDAAMGGETARQLGVGAVH
ncbi:MAG: hypothetical protein JO261_01130, partial [Alphaproteobacteria bacterium]|nr:hypothetical protein [Alphaproteobacteria bacterium]